MPSAVTCPHCQGLIQMYEDPTIHGDGGNVLFCDGRVEFIVGHPLPFGPFLEEPSEVDHSQDPLEDE